MRTLIGNLPPSHNPTHEVNIQLPGIQESRLFHHLLAAYQPPPPQQTIPTPSRTQSRRNNNDSCKTKKENCPISTILEVDLLYARLVGRYDALPTMIMMLQFARVRKFYGPDTRQTKPIQYATTASKDKLFADDASL